MSNAFISDVHSRARRLMLLSMVFGIFAAAAAAQPTPTRPAAPIAGSPPGPTMVPPAPSLTSFMAPVEYFRRLMTATGAEREQLLSSRPDQREQYESFINAYEKLRPEERERRLQAMELRVLITFVLRLQPESRTQVLARLPAELRPLIQSRVDYWNQFSPERQRQMLGNPKLMSLVSYVSPGKTPALPVRSPDTNRLQLQRVETAIRDWNSIPVTRRAAAESEFQRILTAPAPELSRIALPLRPSERVEMQHALDRFKQLNVVQRSNCVRNFSRLAELSTAEREVFLRSAGEWRKMSPEDRDSWRNLIRRTPVAPPPPLPLAPNSILPRLMATNGY